MKCPHCNAMVDDDTIFCGNCGKQIVPLQTGKTAISYATQSEGSNQTSVGADGAEAQRERLSIHRPVPMYRSPSTPQSQIPTLPSSNPRQVDTPPLQSPPQSQPQSRPGTSKRIALIAALILVIVAGGTVGLITLLKNNNTPGVVASHASGQVAFIDSQNGTG